MISVPVESPLSVVSVIRGGFGSLGRKLAGLAETAPELAPAETTPRLAVVARGGFGSRGQSAAEITGAAYRARQAAFAGAGRGIVSVSDVRTQPSEGAAYNGEKLEDVIKRDYPNAPLVERAQSAAKTISGSRAWGLGKFAAKAAPRRVANLLIHVAGFGYTLVKYSAMGVGVFAGVNAISSVGFSAPLSGSQAPLALVEQNQAFWSEAFIVFAVVSVLIGLLMVAWSVHSRNKGLLTWWGVLWIISSAPEAYLAGRFAQYVTPKDEIQSATTAGKSTMQPIASGYHLPLLNRSVDGFYQSFHGNGGPILSAASNDNLEVRVVPANVRDFNGAEISLTLVARGMAWSNIERSASLSFYKNSKGVYELQSNKIDSHSMTLLQADNAFIIRIPIAEMAAAAPPEGADSWVSAINVSAQYSRDLAMSETGDVVVTQVSPAKGSNAAGSSGKSGAVLKGIFILVGALTAAMLGLAHLAAHLAPQAGQVAFDLSQLQNLTVANAGVAMPSSLWGIFATVALMLAYAYASRTNRLELARVKAQDIEPKIAGFNFTRPNPIATLITNARGMFSSALTEIPLSLGAQRRYESQMQGFGTVAINGAA